MILTEAANRLAMLSSKRRKAQKRQNAKNMLLGATLGTVAGAAAGLLLAPRSGRETREQIAQRTGETLGTVKARVAVAKEKISDMVQEKATRLQAAAQDCAQGLKEAIEETDEATEEKSKKKK